MEGSVDARELKKLRSNTNNPDEVEGQKSSECQSKKGRGIILEPVLLGAMLAFYVGQTSLQNFFLQTACSVDLKESLETCESSLSPELEAASQQVVSGVNISRSSVGAIISTIVLLFVGPWSDCSGRRKPLLIMALAGMSVMTMVVLLLITFPGASTLLVLYAVQMPMSLGGNFNILLAAAFSHIGDLCHATGRDLTHTMGRHRAAVQISKVVGSVSGPLLYQYLGFYGVFPIVLIIQLSALIYVIWGVEDVNVNRENKVSFMNWKLPFNAVYCAVKPRDGRRRVIILFMLVVSLFDRMILSGK